MFGSHLSISGGVHEAILAARGLAMDCVQVFTKNQRQWTAPPLGAEAIALWRDAKAKTGVTLAVSHDSYLINLASPDDAAWRKSIEAFADELRRCDQLDIPFLVTHPGAHMGAGEDAGLSRVAAALDELHGAMPDLRAVTCLEITAGQGTSLGHRLEHLRTIIDRVSQPGRVAVCLDSAHMLEAGYDLTTGDGAARVLDEVDRVVGLERVKVWHLNDSKTPRGSRVDRHEHIGHGHVALEAMATIVRHPAFATVPKILETAKEDAPDGRPWDAINLATLRDLRDGKPVRRTAAPPPSKKSDAAAPAKAPLKRGSARKTRHNRP